jgi:hypothetical protein
MLGDNSKPDPLAWAIERLRTFINVSDKVHVPPPPGVISGGSYKTTSPDDEVVRQWAVVERMLARYLPDWKTRVQPPDGYNLRGYRWRDQREAATLCLAVIQGQEEVEQHLADPGPSLTAVQLHPWVWEAAWPAWDAGNYEDSGLGFSTRTAPMGRSASRVMPSRYGAEARGMWMGSPAMASTMMSPCRSSPDAPS